VDVGLSSSSSTKKGSSDDRKKNRAMMLPVYVCIYVWRLCGIREKIAGLMWLLNQISIYLSLRSNPPRWCGEDMKHDPKATRGPRDRELNDPKGTHWEYGKSRRGYITSREPQDTKERAGKQAQVW
jgi:hypothetical protein